MQELQVFGRKFRLSASKWVMLSYSKRFSTKTKNIENCKIAKQSEELAPVKQVRPGGPDFRTFPFDLEGSLLMNAQGWDGGGGTGIPINSR